MRLPEAILALLIVAGFCWWIWWAVGQAIEAHGCQYVVCSQEGRFKHQRDLK